MATVTVILKVVASTSQALTTVSRRWKFSTGQHTLGRGGALPILKTLWIKAIKHPIPQIPAGSHVRWSGQLTNAGERKEDHWEGAPAYLLAGSPVNKLPDVKQEWGLFSSPVFVEAELNWPIGIYHRIL